MSKLLRSRFFSVLLEDKAQPDLSYLLRGEIKLRTVTTLTLSSAVGEQSIECTQQDLYHIASISAQTWEVESDACIRLSIDSDRLKRFKKAGLLLSSANDEESRRLLSRESWLRRSGWSPFAAAFHSRTRSANREPEVGEIDFSDDPGVRRRLLSDFIEANGCPPPIFFRDVEGTVVDMPDPAGLGGFSRLLSQRRTTRSFDPSRSVDVAVVSDVLAATFGCLGVASVAPKLSLQRRSSPSGGGLHPIEAFPFAIRIAGLEPGLYHYESDLHRLRERGPRLSVDSAENAARTFCGGQPWAGAAHFLVFLVARFQRAFWKYRDSDQAYSVIMMDAGHLSQTFYLAAASLKLGAFYSAAIQAHAIEQSLGIDGYDQGVIGVLGCGWPAESDALALDVSSKCER